jgi:hypothetical protein
MSAPKASLANEGLSCGHEVRGPCWIAGSLDCRAFAPQPRIAKKTCTGPVLRENKNVDEGRAVTHIETNMTGPSARKRTGRSSFVSHVNGLR